MSLDGIHFKSRLLDNSRRSYHLGSNPHHCRRGLQTHARQPKTPRLTPDWPPAEWKAHPWDVKSYYVQSERRRRAAARTAKRRNHRRGVRRKRWQKTDSRFHSHAAIQSHIGARAWAGHPRTPASSLDADATAVAVLSWKSARAAKMLLTAFLLVSLFSSFAYAAVNCPAHSQMIGVRIGEASNPGPAAIHHMVSNADSDVDDDYNPGPQNAAWYTLFDATGTLTTLAAAAKIGLAEVSGARERGKGTRPAQRPVLVSDPMAEGETVKVRRLKRLQRAAVHESKFRAEGYRESLSEAQRKRWQVAVSDGIVPGIPESQGQAISVVDELIAEEASKRAAENTKAWKRRFRRWCDTAMKSTKQALSSEQPCTFTAEDMAGDWQKVLVPRRRCSQSGEELGTKS